MGEQKIVELEPLQLCYGDSADGKPLTKLEATEKESEVVRLAYEKGNMVEVMDNRIETFDVNLNRIRVERFKLMGDLKAADMRMVLLYQELELLKEFEKRENVLNQKLADCHGKKEQVDAQIAECTTKMTDKLAQVERVKEQKKEIEAQLYTVVGEQHPHFEALQTIFFKKIKRSKKKEGGDGDGDSDEEDDDDDDDDFDDDDDDDEEEEE